MPKQQVPDIDFDQFVIAELPGLFKSDKIFINEDYQRGDIWKDRQKTALINSIINKYSIGVLVLFINENGQYEILDGQQRLLTVKKYLTGDIDLSGTGLPMYGELNLQKKTLLDAYCIYYLKLKSHDPETREEDIVQTFLRLQEGTPLNKAEKISAYRGKFKDTFKNVRDQHELFKLLGPDRRFRWRQLAAEMLLIELDGNFNNKVFPDIDLDSLIKALKTYENDLSTRKVTFFTGTLDLMVNSLGYILTAFSPREVISFYLLVSWLRKKRAGNQNLIKELGEFAREFLRNLNSFSLYDDKPPKGMTKKIFLRYLSFKQESKVLTTGDSIRKRLEIMIQEFSRLKPIVLKDKKRLHDLEQKRTLYFRQGGICPECGKLIKFQISSSHHVIAHSKGGRSDDLKSAVLLHPRCHARLEKRLEKGQV